MTPAFSPEIEYVLKNVGLAPGDVAHLALQPEARDVVSVGKDCFGRDAFLTAPAADAWLRMAAAANADGMELLLVSGFRSWAKQARLFERKLSTGLPPRDVLRTLMAPGFSEHHTGRALDVGTPGFTELSEAFDGTAAFAWLTRRAGEFGFSLSYPRGNPRGVIYEPWHWFLA